MYFVSDKGLYHNPQSLLESRSDEMRATGVGTPFDGKLSQDPCKIWERSTPVVERNDDEGVYRL